MFIFPNHAFPIIETKFNKTKHDAGPACLREITKFFHITSRHSNANEYYYHR